METLGLEGEVALSSSYSSGQGAVHGWRFRIVNIALRWRHPSQGTNRHVIPGVYYSLPTGGIHAVQL
jgi:hypothetical protein